MKKRDKKPTSAPPRLLAPETLEHVAGGGDPEWKYVPVRR